MSLRTDFVLTAMLAIQVSPVLADDETAGIAFFEKHIRPVLVAKCYECHAADSKDLKGNLLLDSREGIRRGGDSGSAVVPENLDDSVLLEAIRWEGLEMPPDEPLSDDVVAKFEKWVRMGAPDPRDGKAASIRREIDFDKARQFWAFQPISRPEVPATGSDWPRTEIDQFVLTKLQSESLVPVNAASPQQLVRRIYFDLIGLPPTPGQIDEFLQASKRSHEAAIEELVDELLASVHFGERWGRHWLDVARYGESTGMERNATYPYAWRYRDWVIRSLNDDKPFDQFVREQVAGDLLAFESAEQRRDQIFATAFLAIGPRSLNEQNNEAFVMDVIDEQIDVTTRAFLGLTASCARCHDHKFDPVPQKEYYGLAGIFRSTDTFYGTEFGNGNRHPGKLLSISSDGAIAHVSMKGTGKGGSVKATEKKLKSERARLKRYETQVQKNPGNRKLVVIRDKSQTKVDQLRERLAGQRASAVKSQVGDHTMAVLDDAEPRDTQLRLRGEPNDRGDTVPRSFLTIGSVGHVPAIDGSGSGRLELADWLTQDDNPLTARVAVNRIWKQLFGRGLVGTVDNFGANGDRPTHPELLDWLADEFRTNGWSMKNAIRQIMNSRVYQLGSHRNTNAEEIDPGNKLLWRANHRRLEAEAIRDSMLVASGQLDRRPAEGSIVQRVGNGIVGRNVNVDRFASDTVKRSVYLPIVRGVVPEVLAVFDFPEPSMIAGKREVTTVSTQALYMMNSEFVSRQAEAFADRLLGEPGLTDEERVARAWQIAFSRTPAHAEMANPLKFIGQEPESVADSKVVSDRRRNAWISLAHALFASAEFRYVE